MKEAVVSTAEEAVNPEVRKAPANSQNGWAPDTAVAAWHAASIWLAYTFQHLSLRAIVFGCQVGAEFASWAWSGSDCGGPAS